MGSRCDRSDIHGRAFGDMAYKRRITKIDYEALAAFRYALRRFLRFAEEGARAAGLTPQQHQLLLAIKGRPGRAWTSIGELAEALQIRHHTAVGLVDRCEESRLIRRVPDPSDRRLVRVLLTAAGEKILERLSARNRLELETLRQALRLRPLEGPGAGGRPPHGSATSMPPHSRSGRRRHRSE
jgi:DNA-binding MarR family transcriptional regulator